ncbi:MAG: hypothetical protein WDM78_11600 [Puia sp.]
MTLEQEIKTLELQLTQTTDEKTAWLISEAIGDLKGILQTQ